MSKSVKKILKVAAAVAVAYFAPQVSAALLAKAGTAAAASTAASVITTAAVNAAGNAAIAAATGGDVGKAAIMGAVTGGVSGYLAGPAAGAAATTPSPVTTTGGPTLANAGITATGQQVLTGAAPGLGVTTAAPAFTGTGAFAPTAASILGPTSVAGVTPSAVAAAATPTLTLGQRAVGALREAGTEIATKFTDPRAIADMTLRAAGQLAGSALAGSGLSPAEEKLLAAQAADLEELKRTNTELYNLRLEQAKAILGEAARDYGFEEESRAKVRGAGLTTQATRGLTGERRRVELARQQRARAEEAATGRARGEIIGAERTQQARVAGLNALPPAPQAATMSARTGLMGDYAEAERRRKQQAGEIGDYLGALTGQRKAGLYGGIA